MLLTRVCIGTHLPFLRSKPSKHSHEYGTSLSGVSTHLWSHKPCPNCYSRMNKIQSFSEDTFTIGWQQKNNFYWNYYSKSLVINLLCLTYATTSRCWYINGCCCCGCRCRCCSLSCSCCHCRCCCWLQWN